MLCILLVVTEIYASSAGCIRSPNGPCRSKFLRCEFQKRAFGFHWHHSRNRHQKVDGMNSGIDSLKLKRLLRNSFMRKKSK